MLSASVDSANVIKTTIIDEVIRLVPATTDHKATLWQREGKIVTNKTSKLDQIVAQ